MFVGIYGSRLCCRGVNETVNTSIEHILFVLCMEVLRIVVMECSVMAVVLYKASSSNGEIFNGIAMEGALHI